MDKIDPTFSSQQITQIVHETEKLAHSSTLLFPTER